MQLFVLILNKTECMHGILAGFLAGGIKDATIYDSMGMLSYIGHDTVERSVNFSIPTTKTTKLL